MVLQNVLREDHWRERLAASTRFALLVFEHLPELRLMRLRLSETNLSRDERELWHFLAGFLPYGGLVKLRQLLQLGLGELVGRGGDRVLLDTLPVHIFRQKPLQDLPLRSELGILLNLGFHERNCTHSA